MTDKKKTNKIADEAAEMPAGPKMDSGSSSVTASSITVSPSTSSIPSGSIMSTGGWKIGPITTTTASSWTTKAPRVPLVDLPQRITGKVLVAFLDDNDEPVWAKKLSPQNMTLDFADDGTGRMVLELSLVKVYED